METIRRQIEPLVVGTTIIDTWSFGTPRFEQASHATGQRITAVTRRGKYLILDLDDDPDLDEADVDGPVVDGSAEDSTAGMENGHRSTHRELVLHLGMTGRLSTRSAPDPMSFHDADRPTHRRAEWLLDGDTVLEFTDIRRFGRIAVVDAGDHASLPTLAQMGPEPFDPAFDAVHLRSAIMRSRQAIKTQLMSQRVVAGLGNIYVDESLWLAGVHPESRRLTATEADRLRDAIVTTLQSGLVNGGTTLRDYRDLSGNTGSNQLELHCYGRGGLPCDRCGTPLEQSRISGRTTTYCSRCQRRRL